VIKKVQMNGQPTAELIQQGTEAYRVDPIGDPRWDEFVNRHPRASIFHTTGWLEALRQTYGYEPMVLTTSQSNSSLENGIVVCRIDSWLTGRRLVSLPFSDHCELLCDSIEDEAVLVRSLQSELKQQRCKYVELRPTRWNFAQNGERTSFLPAGAYFLHRLDLRPDLKCVFRRLDRDSVQRRILRAERAGLVEKCGKSDQLLNDFYSLFLITRRRHSLPPIPRAWFGNLIASQKNALEIRVAYKGGVAIAAILTLTFRDTVYYKYGCSDVRFNRFGATPWLLWRAVESGKAIGARELDMGRTQADSGGLLTFKNNWVPDPQRFVYWKYPNSAALDSIDHWKLGVAKRIFSHMPDRLLTVAGKLIYPHIG